MEYKDFADASFISAPLCMLERFNCPKEENFPEASYIWPFGYERFHTFRLFTPAKKVIKAEAAFLCDNLFDIWINGLQIAEDICHLPIRDITAFVKEGENNLHIRGYQTSTDAHFSSAISGGIRLVYQDGTNEEIVTDNRFRWIGLVPFWETQEPAGFETATKGNVSDMNVMQMHPLALRRSFYFIRPFKLDKKPISAKLYATALGCYEPYLNGRRIVDAFFMPFCQNYQKEYQEYDVLDMLHTGRNTLGLITGNGSYNCMSWGHLSARIPEVMGILELEYEDGKKDVIYTDEEWLCAPSPLVENDIQYGERYDARLEKEDWCSENVDVSDFVKVHSRKNTEYQELLAQNYPLIKKVKTHALKTYTILPDGTFMFDVGLCIAGRASVAFQNLPRGKKVRIRYCERLTEEGTPENGAYTTVHYQQDCAPGGRSSMFMRNMDVYYAKGGECETYECRFAYTGFRYIWVECLDSVNQIGELTAFELRNDLVEVGEIITQDKALMQIFKAAKRSWLNNLFNGPTDCPTREKNFWNGDTQIFSHAACWLTDNEKFLSRWTDNGKKMHPGPYAWEDETYEIPLTLYRFYGDTEILRRRFPEMIKLIEKRNEFDGMILPEKDSHQYCDWLSPTGVTPDKQFFGGCWYCHMLSSVAEVAEILGEDTISIELRKKAERSMEEFNRRYLVDDGQDYLARNQCGIVLPLAFGIAPREHRKCLAAKLVDYIKEADYHVTTGFVGTRFLFDVLAEYGYGEVAYKVIVNKTEPSWIDMLSTGATAITESWHGVKDPDKSLSMAHFSLGSIVSWFFEYLGGIRIRESEPGLSKIVLKPVMVKEIGDFAVKYRTKYGMIETQWHYEGNQAVFTYYVPDGVSVIE